MVLVMDPKNHILNGIGKKRKNEYKGPKGKKSCLPLESLELIGSVDDLPHHHRGFTLAKFQCKCEQTLKANEKLPTPLFLFLIDIGEKE